MDEIDKVIDSLSEEELDLLNSDSQMLAEFKAKYEKPKSFVEKTASILPEIAQKTFLPADITPGKTAFSSLPMVQGLETLGENVKGTALNAFSNVADKPLPSMGMLQSPMEAMRQVGKQFGETAIQAAPFTPDAFEQFGSAELLPLLITPTKGIAPKYAKATMENIIPARSEEIQNVERASAFGKNSKTTAQKFLDRPYLGNTREEIKMNAQKRINEIQGEIQAGIDSAKDVKASKEDFLKIYDEAIEDLKGVPNRGKQLRAIEKAKNEFLADKNIPENQSLPGWDTSRKKLNKDIGSKGYLSDKTSVQVDLDKRFADKIREFLAEKIPGIKKLRREQGDLLEIRESIVRSAPREVRDPTLWGPFFEETAIRGSKFLSNKRNAPIGGGAVALPLLGDDGQISRE